MRLPLRSPLVAAVPLLLLTSVVLSTAGCSAGADDSETSGPTVTATGSEEPTTGSTDEPSDEPGDEPTDEPSEPTSTASELTAAVAAVCTPYAAMVGAIQDAASTSTDRDEVAAAIGPVMKEFAARVPDLERPPGISPATWHGVQALAARILELPDEPTYAEIEGVEDQLSSQEREAVEAARDWFLSNCGL